MDKVFIWFGPIGFLVTLAALIFSVIVYRRSRRFREPIYYVYPARTEIVSQEKTSWMPLQISYLNGSPLEKDVTAVNFAFWNKGRREIRPEDILEPIKVKIYGEGCKILALRVINMSRDVVNFDFGTSANDPDSEALITFRILEREDGALCQILYEGDPEAEVKVEGTVVGGKVSEAMMSTDKKRTRQVALSMGLLLTIGILTALGKSIARLITDEGLYSLIYLSAAVLLIFIYIWLSEKSERPTFPRALYRKEPP